MAPYLDRKLYLESPSGRMESEATANKVYDELFALVEGSPYEETAYIKTRFNDSCIIQITHEHSKASPREELLTVKAYFKEEDNRFSETSVIKVYSGNVYDKDHRRLTHAETLELLIDIQALADARGEIPHAAREDLFFL